MWNYTRGASFIALAIATQPIAAISADGRIDAFSAERAQSAFVLPAAPEEQAVEVNDTLVAKDGADELAENAINVEAEAPPVEIKVVPSVAIKEVLPVVITEVVAPVKINEVVAPVVITEVVAPVVINTVAPPPAPEPVEPVQIVTVAPTTVENTEGAEAEVASTNKEDAVAPTTVAAGTLADAQDDQITAIEADAASDDEQVIAIAAQSGGTAEAKVPETPLLTTEDFAWKELGDTPSSDALLKFMSAYPDGTYAGEAKARLLDALAREIEEVAPTPTAAPAPNQAPSATETQNAGLPVDTPKATEDRLTVGETEAIIVTFNGPLNVSDAAIGGKSIAELIEGKPIFPPIEDLPEEYWKDQQCSSCHEWQQANLCDQAKFYTGEKGAANLTKQHPYGGGFKSALRVWATSDCQ